MKKVVLIFSIIFISKILCAQNDTIQNSMVYKKFYYKNGKIASEGYLKNNKPIANWKAYYITGVKRSEGKWFNNKLDSVWIFYNQLGDTIEKINYYQGKKNGYNYTYFNDIDFKNVISSKELYVDGKRNDKSYFYYSTAEIKKIIPFLNDKKQGIGYEYDKSGNINKITRYRNNDIIISDNINRYNKDNKKEGIWKEFYNNGVLKEEKIYINGKLNGYYKIFNIEGKLLDAIKYINGEVNTKSINKESDIEIKDEYDENENLVFSGSYKANLPIGIQRFFNIDGKVIKSNTYDIYGNLIAKGIVLINGSKQGKWIDYYTNGNTKATGSYNSDKKHDIWVYYYRNGNIQQTGSYQNDKLKGTWKWYYETGELLKEEFYIYGLRDGEAIEYSKLGDIISKGNYIEGLKENEWIFNIGDQKYIGNYVMDLKNSEWKSYYLANEAISFIGNYLQGNRDGKHVYYYPNAHIKEEKYFNEGEAIKSWSKYDKEGKLVLVVQFKKGKEYKINGVKIEY